MMLEVGYLSCDGAPFPLVGKDKDSCPCGWGTPDPCCHSLPPAHRRLGVCRGFPVGGNCGLGFTDKMSLTEVANCKGLRLLNMVLKVFISVKILLCFT